MDREYRMLDAHILQAQGFTQREIGAMIGVTDRTVRNYLKRMPGSKRRPRRGSTLDTYKPLIEQILDEIHSYNGELIYERLKILGDSGKISILKGFIAGVRRRLVLRRVRDGWRIFQTLDRIRLQPPLPFVRRGSVHAPPTTRLAHIADLLGQFQHTPSLSRHVRLCFHLVLPPEFNAD